ncbi:hypothetical protein ACFSTC_49850 [Nonomuraea ferruginea]
MTSLFTSACVPPDSGTLARHPDPAHARVHLDHHAREQLQPGQPDEQDQHRRDRAGPDAGGEQVQVEQLGADRRADEEQQRVRDAADERQQ